MRLHGGGTGFKFLSGRQGFPGFYKVSAVNRSGGGLAGGGCLPAEPRFAVLQKSADGVQVRYTYGVPTVPGAKAELTYTVEPQGTLLVEAVYHGVPGAPELPCFGVKLPDVCPRGPHALDRPFGRDLPGSLQGRRLWLP